MFCNARSKKVIKDHWGYVKRTQKPAGQRWNSLSINKLLIKKIIAKS